MAYADTATVIAMNPLFPQTSTAAKWTSTVAVISTHLDRVDARINAELARRYSVPFDPVPPYVRAIAEDIVTYWSLRSIYTKDNRNTTDAEERYRMALDDLAMLREGKIDLVATSGSLVAEVGATNDVYSTTKDYTPVFNLDDELRWTISQSQLDAIAGDRG